MSTCICVEPSPLLPGDTGHVMECPVHGERREYDPSDDPEAAERQARREARERYTTDEAWKCPSYWEGGDDV